MSTPLKFDMNLLRVFVAIYKAQSVTQAAIQLEVTQPTVSHSLSKLREVYADPLFHRGAKGLQPTGRANLLFEQFSHALEAVDTTFQSMDAFVPSNTSRKFRLALSDIGFHAFASQLIQRLHASAPLAEFDVQKFDVHVGDEITEGRLDIVIGNLPELGSSTRSRRLFTEDYVCLMPDSFRLIGPTLSLQEFSEAPHLWIESPTRGNNLIDTALAAHGLKRPIVARVPNTAFFNLPELLIRSRLVVVLPSRVAKLFVTHGGLKTSALPLDLPSFEVRAYWHVRNTRSTAHHWLLREIELVLGEYSESS